MFVQLSRWPMRESAAIKISACAPSSPTSPAQTVFQPGAGFRVGGRQPATLPVHAAGDDLTSCASGSRAYARRFSRLPQLVDVNTDQQDKGLQTSLVIDRDTAARLGVSLEPDRYDPERRVRAAARCRRSIRRSTSTMS
jgi:multidrug efflux pump